MPRDVAGRGLTLRLWIAFWVLKEGRTMPKGRGGTGERPRREPRAGDAGAYLDNGPCSVLCCLAGKGVNYQMKLKTYSVKETRHKNHPHTV